MLVCAISLKNIPMGCRNALLPDHLLKERFFNCLTCSQNTCDILIFFQILGVRRENLYDVDTVDGYFVGELVRWSLQNHSGTVSLLRYNSHIYYVANIQALFNAFRCSTCECYFCQPIKLELHSISIYGM